MDFNRRQVNVYYLSIYIDKNSTDRLNSRLDSINRLMNWKIDPKKIWSAGQGKETENEQKETCG